MKKSPPRSKQTATPPDLAKFLSDAYAKKYPHLPPLESHLKDLESQLKQAPKERAGLKKEDLH